MSSDRSCTLGQWRLKILKEKKKCGEEPYHHNLRALRRGGRAKHLDLTSFCVDWTGPWVRFVVYKEGGGGNCYWFESPFYSTGDIKESQSLERLLILLNLNGSFPGDRVDGSLKFVPLFFLMQCKKLFVRHFTFLKIYFSFFHFTK